MAKDTVVQLIPTKSSSSEEWGAWYDSMKSNLGKKKALMLFSMGWAKRGKGTPANTAALRKKMGDEGFAIDTNGFGKLLDTANKGLDFVDDFFVAGKWMTITAGVVIVGGLGLMLYNIAKDPVRSAGAAADLASAVGSRGMARTGKVS